MMRFDQPFLKLPMRFCADTLAAEVLALPPEAWTAHPSRLAGNAAVRLVTPGGRSSDAISGPMAPTDHLSRCPYMTEVMAALGGVWGRSRLMALEPGAEVPRHVDSNYYWRTHLRIHIPVITNPDVHFACGEDVVHMAAGECWTFDSFRLHQVRNEGRERRIHLVLDTVGSERLWDLVEASRGDATAAPRKLLPGEANGATLEFERINSPDVMSPWEIRCHVAFIAEQLVPNPLVDDAMKRLDRFVAGWVAAWARFGTDEQGLTTYSTLIARIQRDMGALLNKGIVLRNGVDLPVALNNLIFLNALGGAGEDSSPLVADIRLGQRLAS